MIVTVMIMIMTKNTTMMTTGLILQFRSVLRYKCAANGGNNAKYRDGMQTRNKINRQRPKKRIKSKNNNNILHQVTNNKMGKLLAKPKKKLSLL